MFDGRKAKLVLERKCFFLRSTEGKTFSAFKPSKCYFGAAEAGPALIFGGPYSQLMPTLWKQPQTTFISLRHCFSPLLRLLSSRPHGSVTQSSPGSCPWVLPVKPVGPHWLYQGLAAHNPVAPLQKPITPTPLTFRMEINTGVDVNAAGHFPLAAAIAIAHHLEIQRLQSGQLKLTRGNSRRQ